MTAPTFITPICRILVGLAFLAASLSKMGDLAAFYLNLHFSLEWLQATVVVALPGIELIAGLALLFNIMSIEAGLITLALLILFILYLLFGIWTGSLVSCDCFQGKLSLMGDQPPWIALLRDIAFLGLNICFVRRSFGKVNQL